MAKVAQARRALTEVEQLREDFDSLLARVENLELAVAPMQPAKPRKTAPAKAQQ